MDGQTDSRYSGGISSFIASSIRVGLGRKGKVLWEGKGSGGIWGCSATRRGVDEFPADTWLRAARPLRGLRTDP